MAENASMISRDVKPIPKGGAEQRRYIEKVLRDLTQDVHTLFSLTTDCDRLEKLRRDNE